MASRGDDVAPTITLRSRVERHQPDLPRYVVVPESAVAPWKLGGTTVVEGTAGGFDFGRRSLKRWDADRWFLDLPGKWCRDAGVSTGDEVELTLRVASSALPAELARLIGESASAQAAWQRLTASQQRMLREHVLAAKRLETRERRARRGLG
ncbi:MAG: YdeI/OmpD-associated family protein [Acidobacteriota bacterium]|nr:YdeI/OmpD-associated family protein [Acidobacteriota bacterium]MDE3264285.1 YdeI/OmpD-associated family protein [Acidobacteriota bacterium]